MKLTLLTIVGICGTLNARLVEKNTDRTITETKTLQLPPRVRLTRDVFEDDTFPGFSKEDNGESVEFVHLNRKERDFYKPNPKQISNHAKKVIRKPRESHEKVEKHKNNSAPHVVKTKTVLVKKPIPKYQEIDYYDDFQMMVSGSPMRVAESGEHEDEDFNVDDYDFDVNHDEYVSRGKPLEPRVKHKDFIEHKKQKPVPKVTVTETKIQSKPLVPTMPVSTSKKHRAAGNKRNANSREVDYYDDITTVRSTEKYKKDSKDSEDEDDVEESKEVVSKVPSRHARSPWKNSYIDKLGEKSSNILVNKLLSVLPMFPTLHRQQMEYLRVSEEPTYD